VQVLKDADPGDKAEIYTQLGLRASFHPQEKRVVAESRPESIMYVGACPRTVCTKRCHLCAALLSLGEPGCLPSCAGKLSFPSPDGLALADPGGIPRYMQD
jgi:hypothetical protein